MSEEQGPPPSALTAWTVTGPARTVFEHPFYATVLEEDLVLPTGQHMSWLRYADERDGVTKPDGVMAICLRDEAVLLSRQYNPGAGRVVWEFPGGGSQPGETPEDAVRRELMEEVGLYPNRLDYLGRFLLNNRRSSQGVRTFVATELEARDLPADDGEHIESCFVSVEMVDRMIRHGEIDNSTLLSGWALFRAARH